MNPNMMNRNSMGCINRGGMNQRDMEPMCHNHKPDRNSNSGNGCNHPDNMPGCGNGCNRPDNMPGCGNGCNYPNEQQLMGMNKHQLLNYLNHVSFSMYDTVLFLDTHPTDQKAIAYFNDMKQARKSALKIYQKKFAPLLLDGVDANCEWTWGLEPLPWEKC